MDNEHQLISKGFHQWKVELQQIDDVSAVEVRV